MSRRRRKKKRDWIAKATAAHPGALHRELGVPEGEPIPVAQVEAAAASPNKTLAARARLALTLRRLKH